MIIKYLIVQIILSSRGDAMICDTIKELRERTGLSQSALAKKVGVTRSAVNAWEWGCRYRQRSMWQSLRSFFMYLLIICLALIIQNQSILAICQMKRNIFCIPCLTIFTINNQTPQEQIDSCGDFDYSEKRIEKTN